MGVASRAATLGLTALVALTGCANLKTRTGDAAYANFAEASGATELDGKPDKVGQACSKNVLGFVSYGDSSIMEAKRKGGVVRVVSVDHSFTAYAGFFAEVCTTVRGFGAGAAPAVAAEPSAVPAEAPAEPVPAPAEPAPAPEAQDDVAAPDTPASPPPA